MCEDLTAVERDFVSAHASQVNAQDILPTSRPNSRVEFLPLLSVFARASSDTSALKRHREDEDDVEDEEVETVETDNADTTDEQDTAETSGRECDTSMQLPRPPRYKSPLSLHGRRSGATCRVGDRARGDRRETTPLQRRLLHQDSDGSDEKPTRAFSGVGDEDDEDDEDYSPSRTETCRPQRKRRKISTLPRHVQEHPTSDDSSEGRTAAVTVPATYDEWPLQDVRLKRVREGSRTVFQLQFAWDSRPQHHSKACGSQRESARKLGVSGTKFTEDEDALLIKPKEVECLPWVKIHRRFSEEFRGRSQGTLQVRYSNKLKGRKQQAGRR